MFGARYGRYVRYVSWMCGGETVPPVLEPAKLEWTFYLKSWSQVRLDLLASVLEPG